MLRKILLLACIAGLSPTARAATNLVTNGGFEQTGLSGNFEFDNSYAAGAGQLRGWSSDGGYNLLFHSDTANTAAGNAQGKYSQYNNEYMWSSTASPNGGGNFVALDGDQSFGKAITQMITGLTVGQTYNLMFDWGAGQLHSRTGDTTNQLEIAFGNSVFDTNVLSNPSKGFTGWKTVSTSFVASSTSQTLSFLAKGTPAGLPPIALLDNVSLTAAVPEPASWAMMLAGFGALGFTQRGQRRRRLGVAA